MKFFVAVFLMIIGPAIAFTWPENENRENADHFYNIDTEIEIEGQIEKIFFESRYAGKDKFLLILIKELSGEKIFTVEISPSWFFGYDLHKGERVRILGSYYKKEDRHYLLAREVRVDTERFVIRDCNGFPYWREGKMMRRMKRRSPR